MDDISKKTKAQLVQKIKELCKTISRLKTKEKYYLKMKEHLRDTEEKYKILLETTDIGCLILDSNGRVVDANQQFVNFTGYKTLEEIKGRSVLEWTAKYDRKRNLERIRECAREGIVRSVQIDYCPKDKDKRIISLEIDGTVIKTQKRPLILALLKDVTERKRLEKQLIQSEERYRTAIEHSNDGVAIIQKTRFLYVNQQFLKIFGYENPNEIIGKLVFKVIHHDDRKRLSEYNLMRQRGLPAPSKYEFKGIRKDKKQIMIEVSPVVTTYQGENVTLLYLRDITDRKRYEEMLDRVNECLLSFKPDAEANIRELLKTAVVIFRGFWTLYLSQGGTTYLVFNVKGSDVSSSLERTSCKKIYNLCTSLCPDSGPLVFTRNELISYNFIKPFFEGKGFKTCIVSRVKKGEEDVGFLTVFYKDERNFDLNELRIFSILTRGLGVEEERKVALEKLKEQQQKLEVSEKNLKKFSGKILSISEEEKKKLAIALHDEVGSMAVSLNAHLSLAQEEIRDRNLGDALKRLEVLKREIEKFVQRFKKIAIDLRPLNLEILGLSNVLREYLQETAMQTKLQIDFNDNLNGVEMGEETAIILYRITQEAINNIIKHAHASKIVIDLKPWNNDILLDIYDNGKGFDPEKVTQTSSRMKMGIWGMRESVETFGGTFSLHSSQGEGTQIHIRLPRK